MALAQVYVNGGWKKAGDVVPSVEGLACELGIHKDTLYVRSEFSDALKTLDMQQGRALINGGLAGTFNGAITKLLLASKHGYVEKSATEHTGKDGNPIVFDVMGKAPAPDANSSTTH